MRHLRAPTDSNLKRWDPPGGGKGTMPVERKDDGWIGRLLSRHADRRDLDLDAFMVRIMAEVNASHSSRDEITESPPLPVGAVGAKRHDLAPASVTAESRVRNPPTRRRLVPALIAAAVFAVVGSSVFGLALLTARDDRAALLGSSSSTPSPTPSPTLSPTLGEG